jgi:predicted metalloprotease
LAFTSECELKNQLSFNLQEEMIIKKLNITPKAFLLLISL